jgi:hypothetical protein
MFSSEPAWAAASLGKGYGDGVFQLALDLPLQLVVFDGKL